MKETDILEINENAVKLIGKEWMLITAGNMENYNTMTASWGNIGFLWGKPVATIYVRPQRYTLEYIEREECFTLSFFPEQYRKALNICGTKSGRDTDKVKEAGLTPYSPSDGIVSFKEARLVMKCRKLYKGKLKDSFKNTFTTAAHYERADNAYKKMYGLDEKVYNKLRKKEERPLRGEVAFKMGNCYRLLNMSSRSSAAYQNALRYEYPDSMAHFYLAQALQRDGKYAAAIESYKRYLEFCPSDTLAINGVKGCEDALAWRGHASRYEVKNARLFNSRRSDFSPMYLGADYDQLYFTSTTEKAIGDKKSEITGMKNADVFFSKKNERGEWERPEAVEGELNTELDKMDESYARMHE